MSIRFDCRLFAFTPGADFINVFALLDAARAALEELETVIEPWGDTVREMVLAARKTIDDVVCSQAVECFEQPEWGRDHGGRWS